MFLLRDKLITESKKRETSTENLQRNNVALHVESFFASLILLPLPIFSFIIQQIVTLSKYGHDMLSYACPYVAIFNP